METKLAKKTYFILITGLLFIGILLSLIGFQLRLFFHDNSNNPVTEISIIKVLNESRDNLNSLKQKLALIPGITLKVQAINHNSLLEANTPIITAKHIRPPFDWKHPFIIKQNDQNFLISITPTKYFSFFSIIYLVTILLLILSIFLLCYWAIKRLEKIYLLAEKSLSLLSKNIYSQIILPIDNEQAHKLYNEIQAIQHILQQTLQKRTEMLAAISHDLKTPITRLKLRIELLDDSEPKHALLSDILNLEAMITSILTFSKNFIEDESTVNFDLSLLIESLCDDAIDLGYLIDCQMTPHLIYHGRMMAIKRALSNILDNAIKYGQSSISVKLYQKKQTIICQISDLGMGVNPDDYHKLFEPFYRLDQSRNPKIQGSGLGLSIAKEIIEGHGGSIKLLPNQPQGLLVEIILPF